MIIREPNLKMRWWDSRGKGYPGSSYYDMSEWEYELLPRAKVFCVYYPGMHVNRTITYQAEFIEEREDGLLFRNRFGEEKFYPFEYEDVKLRIEPNGVIRKRIDLDELLACKTFQEVRELMREWDKYQGKWVMPNCHDPINEAQFDNFKNFKKLGQITIF